MRVIFLEDSIRKQFFLEVKSSVNHSWKKFYTSKKISRQTLDRYKSGKFSIPQELFKEMLSYVTSNKQEFFLSKIKLVEDNWGKIIGGKKAYKLNKEKFSIGRKKGLESLRNPIYLKRKEESFKVDFYLTEDLCQFIGAFIGDGCFNKYKKVYQIEFAGDSRYDLEYHQKILIPAIKEMIPELRPHQYFPKNTNSVRTVFYSKKLFLLLKDGFNFTPGKKAHTVKIPSIILNSEEKYIKKVIRGIFDTDGGIFFDKRKNYKTPYSRVYLDTKSFSLYDQLVKILSKEFKVYSKFNKAREIYQIEIYGKDQLKKWIRLIGFSNKRHLKKLPG